MALRGGTLRHLVSVQSKSNTVDSYGQPLNTWTEVKKVWADIQAASGRELMAAQAIQATVSHMITVRYDAIFADPIAAAALRIVYGSRVFELAAPINEDERNRTITFGAAEGLTQG